MHAAAVGANVMAVLRTGAGKTMAVVGCMLAGLPRIAGQQQRNLVVLVVPLLALKQAIVGSLQKYFKSDGADEVLAWAPTECCLAKGIGPQVRVVVVTVEDVASEAFYPRFAGRVSVLFVDEAHWLLDGQSFRPAYTQAPAVIRALACPVVCMTATATPKMRRDILELLSLTTSAGLQVLNIAQSCQRMDMVYRVTPMQPVASGRGGEVDAFVRLVLATWDEPEWRSRRILIYCLKRESCPEVAERLRRQMANAAAAGAQVIIGVYMGGGVDNPTTLAAFTAPGSAMRALVGTDSIGCGLDVADIGIVFHYGAAATSVERFLQQTGRAGRSGRPGEGGLSVVVPSVLERSDVEKAIKEKEGSADGSIAGSPGPKYWAEQCRRPGQGEAVRHADGSFVPAGVAGSAYGRGEARAAGLPRALQGDPALQVPLRPVLRRAAGGSQRGGWGGFHGRTGQGRRRSLQGRLRRRRRRPARSELLPLLARVRPGGALPEAWDATREVAQEPVLPVLQHDPQQPLLLPPVSAKTADRSPMGAATGASVRKQVPGSAPERATMTGTVGGHRSVPSAWQCGCWSGR